MSLTTTHRAAETQSYILVPVGIRQTVLGAKRDNRVAKDRDVQLQTMPLLCRLQGTPSSTGHPHQPGVYVGTSFSIWGQ